MAAHPLQEEYPLQEEHPLQEEFDNFSQLKVYNVVVFGNCGAGKSSVCNLIFDSNVFKSSDGPMGCSFTHQHGEGSPPGYPSMFLNLYDTAGLDEDSDGTVSSKDAFIQLVKLLYSIQNGIDLLICCAPITSRLSIESFKTNYRVFVKELCEDKVPCILVLTSYDFIDDENSSLDAYWKNNKAIILKELKLKFVNGISVTTKKTGKTACLKDYNLSREILVKMIEQHALEKSWIMDSYTRKISTWFRKMWNRLFILIPSFQVSIRNDLFRMFTNDLRMEPEKAKEEADRLYKAIMNQDSTTQK